LITFVFLLALSFRENCFDSDLQGIKFTNFRITISNLGENLRNISNYVCRYKAGVIRKICTTR